MSCRFGCGIWTASASCTASQAPSAWSGTPPLTAQPQTPYKSLIFHRYSDSLTFIVSLYDDLLRPHKVLKHRLADPPSAAVEIFNETDASVFIDVSCSKDGKVMLVSKSSKSSSEVWFAPAADPSARFECVRRRREGVRYFVEHCDGWLYVMHNDGC